MPPTDFVNRGQALVAAGNYQEAVKVCRLGLLGRPTAIDARLILAQALLALRRYDEVLAEMRVALELDSHLAAAHGLKGEALLRKGDVHAAREVLMQARALAPGDPSIAALVAETDLAIASGGNRLPSGADGDPQTKHYPTHRGVRDGLLPHHGAPGSQSFTRPTQVDAIPGAASAPFERTGTVEIDPEESGIELVDDDLGDVIDPPSPSGRTSVLVDDDLVEVADDDVLDADELLDPSGSRSIDLGGSSRETVAGRPGARAGSRRGSAGPDLGAMFPEDDATGVLDALLGELPGGGPPGASVAAAEIPLRAPAPTGPAPTLQARPAEVVGNRGALRPARPGEDMRMIRAGLGLDPDARLPVEADKPRRADPSTGILLDAEGARRADPSVGAAAPGDDLRPRAERTRKVATDPGGRVVRPPRRSRVKLILSAALALGVIGGGVYGGFRIRAMRLDRQVADARRQADAAARADTWRGWRQARDILAGIVDAQGTTRNRAALAHAEAVLAADFGDDVEVARAAVAALGESREPEARIARAYLAMLDGDGAQVDAEAAALAEAEPGSAAAAYLAGRAALIGERWADAIAAFDRARAAGARPAYLLGLAAAQAGARDWPSARAALDLVLADVPGHPAAVVAGARLAAARGKPEAVGDAVAALEALLAESARPIDEQALGVSPSRAAWAALALAEVQVMLGDAAAARRALERARAGDVVDRDFAVAEIDVLLALGDVAAARAEAERATKAWPAAAAVHVAAAEVALADGDAARALVELEPAGDLAGRPEALALRGRARLAQGQVDPATADLDAALALAPDLEPALVARAEVDLRAGNARAAVGLLERHYREDGAGPLAITYAAALRGVGELDRARTVLATLTRDDVASPLAGEAWLETARLERDAGNPRAARAAYAKAIERSPRTTEARLEAAELAIDTGDAAGARESLDKLRADAPTDGRVLVETARVHVLTGDLDGAKALLEQAEAAPDAPRWLIQRERGRLALRQRVLPVAIEALERAASLEPGDGETRLLLIDAHLGADDGASARRVLEDVMKRFAGRPEMQLAVGRVRLYFDALGEAREAFVKAKDQLEREKAAPRWIAEATYWLARTTYYDGDADKARPLAVQALQLDPNLVDAHALLGTIDSERGQFKAAAASWEKVTRLDPAADEAWFELGAAAAQSRQKKLARKALETFLQRVPTSDLAPEAKKLLAKL